MRRSIRPLDPEWPRQLNEIAPHRPPEQLFACGLPLDTGVPAIAIVGTRRPTGAGLDAASTIARAVAEAGWIVVSGLAVGIDAAAHRSALDAGGITVAVLGCGLDVDYPTANSRLRNRIAEHGTVLTEYPPGTPPIKHHFPERNRIIAGFCMGTVVIEGSLRSGAMVTARLALDMNRNVYAVPGSPRNPMAAAPNDLIRTSRALLVTEARHIFDDLAPSLAWPERVSTGPHVVSPCTGHERAVLMALDDMPLPLERVARDAKLSPGRAAVLLAQLEVRGLVIRGRAGYARAASGTRALAGAE